MQQVRLCLEPAQDLGQERHRGQHKVNAAEAQRPEESQDLEARIRVEDHVSSLGFN